MKKSFGARTLLFPTPVWIIGTYDKALRPNAMTVAWGGICSSSPPCVAVSLRKATYSHGNIMESRAFTVNVPSAGQIKIADYFGLVSGRSVDKFAAAGVTAVHGEKVDAPYIQEFPMNLECKLLSVTEVGIHTHFIGEILDVKVDELMLGKDGLPDIQKIMPVIYAPETQTYYTVGNLIGRAFSAGKEIK
jgi:flavin reductase (DIM6/NTAB) family NADH-FMN oxidoreductase RutF